MCEESVGCGSWDFNSLTLLANILLLSRRDWMEGVSVSILLATGTGFGKVGVELLDLVCILIKWQNRVKQIDVCKSV